MLERRGDGTYVTSLTPDLLLDAMSFVVDIYQDWSALELFEVRRILEPVAVTLAARRAKPSNVEHLLGLLAQVHGTTSVDDLVAHGPVQRLARYYVQCRERSATRSIRKVPHAARSAGLRVSVSRC